MMISKSKKINSSYLHLKSFLLITTDLLTNLFTNLLTSDYELKYDTI